MEFPGGLGGTGTDADGTAAVPASRHHNDTDAYESHLVDSGNDEDLSVLRRRNSSRNQFLQKLRSRLASPGLDTSRAGFVRHHNVAHLKRNVTPRA
jgi:hypothetical protein